MAAPAHERKEVEKRRTSLAELKATDVSAGRDCDGVARACPPRTTGWGTHRKQPWIIVEEHGEGQRIELNTACPEISERARHH